jgi:hypothetical protein
VKPLLRIVVGLVTVPLVYLVLGYATLAAGGSECDRADCNFIGDAAADGTGRRLFALGYLAVAVAVGITAARSVSLRTKRHHEKETRTLPGRLRRTRGWRCARRCRDQTMRKRRNRGELVTAGALIAFSSSGDWAEELAAAVRRNARQARGEVARYDDVTVVYLTNAKRETIENCVESDNDPRRLYCFRLARTKRRPQPERGGRCPDVSCSGRVSSAPGRG